MNQQQKIIKKKQKLMSSFIKVKNKEYFIEFLYIVYQNEIQKQKILLLEQEKNELIYQLDQFQGILVFFYYIGFEQENIKYQELVEKFEEQSRLKEDEFQRVKEQIKLKFQENESVIVDLRNQLKEEKDIRYGESTKFTQEIERFQQRLQGWEIDCERLENLKRNNEVLIQQMRDEHKQKEGLLKDEIDRLKRSDFNNQSRIDITLKEKEKFKEEFIELERLVQNQLKNGQQDFSSIQKQLEDTQLALHKEKNTSAQLKDGLEKSMERLLHEKNLLAQDYRELKTQLQQHNELIRRQELNVKDLLLLKDDQQSIIDKLCQEKEDLEREVSRTAMLLKEMTDAQQITCSKFSEFQRDIKNLIAENKQLKEQINKIQQERHRKHHQQNQDYIQDHYLQKQREILMQQQNKLGSNPQNNNSSGQPNNQEKFYEPAIKHQNQAYMNDFERQKARIDFEYRKNFQN
ncbi:UNKNOWN [Stylonychia lemnae]|uniref:Uncharacterized protein n=1 Tax=Stylonychia lemnae TaxID=5949 RepID=A0A078AN55_STYLE|nr:UNKNOWN [Stylonychia lemnae]|eukprot:CDW83356.1 UNKNOWN [Stylonychia lemnae]